MDSIQNLRHTDANQLPAQTIDIVERMAEAFLALDYAWTIVYANRAACALLGFNADQIVGRYFWSLWPAGASDAKQPVLDALDEHGEASLHLPLPSPHFEQWIDGAVIRAEHGFNLFLLPVSNLDSQSTLADENARLREAEKDFSRQRMAILESITDGFISFDLDWRVTYINKAAEDLLGRSRQELVGYAAADLVPQWDENVIGSAARQSFADQKPAYLQAYSEGHKLWIDTRIYPSPDATSIFLHDITREKEAEAERFEAIARQRSFLRDVLTSVTEGRLHLCDSVTDLPAPLPEDGGHIALTESSRLCALRHAALDAAEACSLCAEGAHDLVTAVGEAGMNAIVHAGGGVAAVTLERSTCRVQVRIEDHGAGIALENLPKATLARGYSTKESFGHGFKMMLQTADRVFLVTGPTGTTVVVEQDCAPKTGVWPY